MIHIRVVFGVRDRPMAVLPQMSVGIAAKVSAFLWNCKWILIVIPAKTLQST